MAESFTQDSRDFLIGDVTSIATTTVLTSAAKTEQICAGQFKQNFGAALDTKACPSGR